MAEQRKGFSTRIGFIMAAAGSAVGVGNIWGFPTQAAENGGGAFLLVYLVLVFLLGYPMLVSELLIGRYGQASPVGTLTKLAPGKTGRSFSMIVGMVCLMIGVLIMSFYGILAGWFIGFTAEPVFRIFSADAADWLVTGSTARSLILTLIFCGLTSWVLLKGVRDGIEKWSKRLMPVLLVLLAGCTVYMLFQEGAMEGLTRYLVPDFSKLGDFDLILSALGQAFFSLSIGVGTMLIYGSYLGKNENIPRLAAQVTLMDTGVAFLAGLLIIPAMYAGLHNGVVIFDETGALLSSDTLVFDVLPALFATMGGARYFISFMFFFLMVIAALTSSISMLEPAVAYFTETHGMKRRRSVLLVASLTAGVSIAICLNFGVLFGFVINLATVYLQPLMSLVFALYVGWVWKRDAVLTELRQGCPDIEGGVFWRVWPFYVKFVCPVLVLILIVRSFF